MTPIQPGEVWELRGGAFLVLSVKAPGPRDFPKELLKVLGLTWRPGEVFSLDHMERDVGWRRLA